MRCGIRVGGEERTWQVGKCLVFEDSFEHEAWNDGNETRAVLVVDLWHPDLTSIEIQALRGLHRHVHLQAEHLAVYWKRNEEGRTLMLEGNNWL
jgi:aspartyl/asparaginyl beta-hydroxylase (cupin superfamily)